MEYNISRLWSWNHCKSHFQIYSNEISREVKSKLIVDLNTDIHNIYGKFWVVHPILTNRKNNVK